jgi:hypothetical protein
MAMSARRLLLAGGFALAVVLAPNAAAFADPTATLADPSMCTVTRSGSSSSIVCSPGASSGVSPGGAPSQQDLTAKNAQRAHGGLLGGMF